MFKIIKNFIQRLTCEHDYIKKEDGSKTHDLFVCTKCGITKILPKIF